MSARGSNVTVNGGGRERLERPESGRASVIEG